MHTNHLLLATSNAGKPDRGGEWFGGSSLPWQGSLLATVCRSRHWAIVTVVPGLQTLFKRVESKGARIDWTRRARPGNEAYPVAHGVMVMAHGWYNVDKISPSFKGGGSRTGDVVYFTPVIPSRLARFLRAGCHPSPLRAIQPEKKAFARRIYVAICTAHVSLYYWCSWHRFSAIAVCVRANEKSKLKYIRISSFSLWPHQSVTKCVSTGSNWCLSEDICIFLFSKKTTRYWERQVAGQWHTHYAIRPTCFKGNYLNNFHI